jgi:3',5'-cyclic AMP phosphodiesterase CpdA
MVHAPSLTRRSFLRRLSIGTSLALYRVPAFAAERAPLRFGLIADVHQDIMHDATRRVGHFVEAMTAAKPDFICQLGDFCIPHERNRDFLKTWRKFDGPRYHVLGNHDMDDGFSRDQTVEYYGMPSRYYSFDRGGIHFIALDGNDPGGQRAGYPCYIAEEQAAWLADDLARTESPTVVFSHQPLDIPGGIENSAEIRPILESARLPSGEPKVVACFCGHTHADSARRINGILYFQINSASYLWVGARFAHRSYSEAVHRNHPHIEKTIPYKDPIWALATVDLQRGVLTIEGRQSTWVGPDPWQLGTSADRKYVRPAISNWRMPF